MSANYIIFCRSMQEVQLDKNVRLLDSPGIVMATGDETSAHTILRNAVKVEQIEDPAAPVEIILSRCRKDQMMMQYKVRFLYFSRLHSRGISRTQQN